MGPAHGDLRAWLEEAGEVLRRRRPDAAATATDQGRRHQELAVSIQLDKRERVMDWLARESSASPRPAPRPMKPASCWPPGSIRSPTATASDGRPCRRAAHRHVQACLDQLLDCRGDRWREKHVTSGELDGDLLQAVDAVAVADIDVAMVLKVIEPHWKRAPETMDRVRRRIGDVLGWLRCAAAPARTAADRWKNHLDKPLPHPRALKPVVHHAAMAYDEVPDLYREAGRHRCDPRAVPRLHDPDGCPLAGGARRALGRDRFRGGRLDRAAERMKRSREHRVPLSKEALKLIEGLPRTASICSPSAAASRWSR